MITNSYDWLWQYDELQYIKHYTDNAVRYLYRLLTHEEKEYLITTTTIFVSDVITLLTIVAATKIVINNTRITYPD